MLVPVESKDYPSWKTTVDGPRPPEGPAQTRTLLGPCNVITLYVRKQPRWPRGNAALPPSRSSSSPPSHHDITLEFAQFFFSLPRSLAGFADPETQDTPPLWLPLGESDLEPLRLLSTCRPPSHHQPWLEPSYLHVWASSQLSAPPRGSSRRRRPCPATTIRRSCPVRAQRL